MTKTIKVKAGDLSGVALDWAVDAAETGDPMRVEYKKDGSGVWMLFDKHNMYATNGPQKYSTDWKLAGPIIKRENISLSPPTSVIHVNGGNNPGWRPSGYWQACTWHPGVSGKRAFAWHETEPLIAAMRCYVRSKLGDEIEVPAELVEGGA